jgi:hypothetical protein
MLQGYNWVKWTGARNTVFQAKELLDKEAQHKKIDIFFFQEHARASRVFIH